MGNNVDPKDLHKYQDNYSDSKLMDKIMDVAKKAGIKVIYCALLAYEVVKSPDVPTAQKAIVIGALGYFILPVDLVPDFIPVVGYADDLAAIIAAIRTVYIHITPEMKANAERQLVKWFGDFDRSDIEDLF